MKMKINGCTPEELRYGGRSLNGLASGNKIVWKKLAGYTITISINPVNIPQVDKIEAIGNVLKSDVSFNKDVYTFTIAEGGEVTINIVPAKGYQVKQLNIDQVGQGSVSSYTFTNVISNHTGYIWMQEAPIEQSTTVYVRSDQASMEYLSLESAVKSLMADYPEGLNEDVTILCITEGIDFRGSGLYTFNMQNWNLDTPYTLTLDGANLAILDGRGFGGLYIEECSNIIIRNFTFQNFCTYEKVYAPEETACIYVTNVTEANPCRNIYIENIIINGQSTISPSSNYKTRYGITVKNYENVYICNCKMNSIAVMAIKLTNVKLVSIIKNQIVGAMISGIIGHPYVISSTGAKELRIEDCSIDGSGFNESAIHASGIENFYLYRNEIYNCKGNILGLSSLGKINEVVIEYNYLHDNLLLPLYSWECQWITITSTNEMRLANNLVVFSSNYFQEFFLRSNVSNVGRLVNVNNIFIRRNNQNHAIIMLGEVDELVSGNNIYKLNSTLFYSTSSISSSIGRSFEKLVESGYETDSVLVPPTTNILISETGGTRNCLIPSYASIYKAISDYVGEFDIVYKKNDPQNTTIGSENYYATSFNEESDTTDDYTGKDVSSGTIFTSLEQYNIPAQNQMILHHLSKKRIRFVKFIVSASDNPDNKIIYLGKHCIFSVIPKLDINGEYISDQLYDITIE